MLDPGKCLRYTVTHFRYVDYRSRRCDLSHGESSIIPPTPVALASEKGRLPISGLKAVQVDGCTQSIVKVETDAGISGYAEAGGPGPMIRGNLKYFERFVLGQDPNEIDKLYNLMVHGSIPTVRTFRLRALWTLRCGTLLAKYSGSPSRNC